MPSRRTATACEREAGVALHTQYARECRYPFMQRHVAPNDSCVISRHVRLIASGRFVGKPEIGKTKISLISPFELTGEQVEWVAHSVVQLLDLSAGLACYFIGNDDDAPLRPNYPALACSTYVCQ
jgi:hypothetical protein